MAQRLVRREHLGKEGEAFVGDDILAKADLDKSPVYLQ